MPAKDCILDASILISLGKAGRLDVLGKTRSYRWHVAQMTRQELVKPETREPVEQFILDGRIAIVGLDSDDPPGMELLAEWSDRVDPGEAESIAIALARGWLIGLEDLQARRLLDRTVGPGRWINCANVLIDALNAGSLSLPEGEGVFQSLDVYSSYVKAGVTTLRSLLR